MTHEEQLLVESVQRGEGPAFRDLVERYKQKVYYLALDMTGNHHDAEDLSQEVFMKVFTSIKDFRGDSKLSSWMYRITVNTCIDKTRRKHFQLVELHDEIQETSPGKSNPQQDLEDRDVKQRIDQALQKLPARQRCIFAMRHYNELMLREIAEILGISEGTVKAQLFRAIRRLQKELQPFRSKRTSTNEAL